MEHRNQLKIIALLLPLLFVAGMVRADAFRSPTKDAPSGSPATGFVDTLGSINAAGSVVNPDFFVPISSDADEDVVYNGLSVFTLNSRGDATLNGSIFVLGRINAGKPADTQYGDTKYLTIGDSSAPVKTIAVGNFNALLGLQSDTLKTPAATPILPICALKDGTISISGCPPLVAAAAPAVTPPAVKVAAVCSNMPDATVVPSGNIVYADGSCGTPPTFTETSNILGSEQKYGISVSLDHALTKNQTIAVKMLTMHSYGSPDKNGDMEYLHVESLQADSLVVPAGSTTASGFFSRQTLSAEYERYDLVSSCISIADSNPVYGSDSTYHEITGPKSPYSLLLTLAFPDFLYSDPNGNDKVNCK